MPFYFITEEEFSTKGKCENYKPKFEVFEHPMRVRSIINYLTKCGLFKHKDVQTVGSETISDSDIMRVHTPFMLENIKRKSGDLFADLGYLVTSNADIYELSMKSVGAVLRLAKLISGIESPDVRKANEDDRMVAGFSLNRPPGHHAYPNVSEGLCVFNNLAIAIKILREKYQYKEKIAIIDIDAHYGNGISSIFYDDPSVLYISIHAYDFDTEDWGYVTETGTGEGRGFNINIPLPINCTEKIYLKATDCALKICEQFKPSLLFVETGFDGHYSDPLGNLLLSESTYGQIGIKIKQYAEKHIDNRVGFVLEGGYNPLILGSLTEKLISPFIEGWKAPEPIDEPLPFSVDDNILSDNEFTFNSVIKRLRKAVFGIWDI